ncbi:CHAT domain-containing tetratricopeptide repeat protein [Maribellus sp. YY47]|uniref:CHAT domain-containing protein n=1 Tax=Maribellus sp. YY47 TaxID=2929486 RepID=UPI0020011F00|nr:CHAT domain-containing tetratricopeptide repeat protein [Maribellus sp. YY47]MCK3685401.1 CHAT domain-containing protein [Maribellus sp. YY47]
MLKKEKVHLIFCLLLLPIFLYGQTDSITTSRMKANNLLRSGYTLHAEGRYSDALDSFKLSLAYRKKIYGEQNYFLAQVYLAIGISYKAQGQNEKALQFYEVAERNYLLRNDSNLINLGRLYRNIGNVYRAKLDYNNALHYFNQALTIFLNQETIEYEDIYDANYAIAEIYSLTKEFNKALEILNKYKDEADTFNRIYYLELLGIIYQKIDNISLAKLYYEKNLDLVKSYYGKDHLQTAITYLNYSEFLTRISEYEEGLIVLNKAFDIIQKSQKKRGVELSRYYEYQAEFLRNKPVKSPSVLSFKQQKKRNLEDAVQSYNESLKALYKKDDELKIEDLTTDNCLSFTDCVVLLKAIADTYSEIATLNADTKDESYLNSLDHALNFYKTTSNLIQRARMEISSDESKLQLAKLESSTFSKAIETAYLAYEHNQDEEYLNLAFKNAEQMKSSAVFDKISNDLAQQNSLIPDTLLELENKLNSTISTFNEKLFEEQNKDSVDSKLVEEYNSKIFEASKRRNELNRLLEEEYPDYYNLKYSTSMLGINDIQKKLKKNEAILEYSISQTDSTSKLFSFVVTKDNKFFTCQNISSEKEQSLQYMFHFMTTPNFLFTHNQDSKLYCQSANDIYTLLIQPFQYVIQNKDLIVIPDGQLNYIAFDGLIQSMPDTSQVIDFSKLNYLIRDYNINYANSANIYFKNSNTKRHLKNRTLAFAPVYNSESFELSNARYTLMPLPGVQKEVDAIANTVKSDVFRGQEATEERFRELSQKYDILHLAMHAYINDSLPAFSRLAFSPMPKTTNEELNKDGWLNTADIYNLNLRNTRLAVLSACNTGVGKMQKGEGLMSLSRGFLYAGCPSIVVSLWEVEDQAGTEIMTAFYKNLKKGKTKDEALRLAKIEYLDHSNSRLAHPHYWMSFKCIGDNSPLYTSYDIYFFGILILLILVFSIDQIVRIKKARLKRQAS